MAFVLAKQSHQQKDKKRIPAEVDKGKLTGYLLDKHYEIAPICPSCQREKKLDSRAQKAVGKAPMFVNQL